MRRSRKKEQPKNAKELKESLIRVWESIEVVVLKKVVDSVPNRLNEVIDIQPDINCFKIVVFFVENLLFIRVFWRVKNYMYLCLFS